MVAETTMAPNATSNVQGTDPPIPSVGRPISGVLQNRGSSQHAPPQIDCLEVRSHISSRIDLVLLNSRKPPPGNPVPINGTHF